VAPHITSLSTAIDSSTNRLSLRATANFARMTVITRSSLPSTSTLMLAALSVSCFAPVTSGFYTRTMYLQLAPSRRAPEALLAPVTVADAPESTEPTTAVGSYPGASRATFFPLPSSTAVPVSVDSLPAPPTMYRSSKITCYFLPMHCKVKRSIIMDSNDV